MTLQKYQFKQVFTKFVTQIVEWIYDEIISTVSKYYLRLKFWLFKQNAPNSL